MNMLNFIFFKSDNGYEKLFSSQIQEHCNNTKYAPIFKVTNGSNSIKYKKTKRNSPVIITVFIFEFLFFLIQGVIRTLQDNMKNLLNDSNDNKLSITNILPILKKPIYLKSFLINITVPFLSKDNSVKNEQNMQISNCDIEQSQHDVFQIIHTIFNLIMWMMIIIAICNYPIGALVIIYFLFILICSGYLFYQVIKSGIAIKINNMSNLIKN